MSATASTTLQNFIDGEPARSDAPRDAILNPATGEELAQAPNSSPQDVDRAVRAARAAFADWSQSTPARRSQALLALAEILDDPYVRNRCTPHEVERLLDRPELIRALGDDVVSGVRAGRA